MSEPAKATSTKKAPHIGLVIAGLMLGILLAALDQTVVGTSLRGIVEDIGGFEHFSWVFASYILASTVMIPIAGKLSDVYGRRPIYIAGMTVFLLGSMLCGTAQDIYQLIGYRALQGLGGGAIFPVALATIADLFPPSERGRIGGIFGAVFGLSSVIGPFVGGWIVDYVHIADIDSWRWVFYVNLPVGIIGITFVALFFPRKVEKHPHPIDYGGVALLTVSLLSALLIAVWGGDTYGWTSPQILGLAALSLAALAAFIFVEQRVQDPVVPLALFKDPVVAVSAIASLLSGAAMFTVISFMPIYLQGVVGMSATYAGTVLIPLSLGIVTGAGSSGGLMKRFGYKIFAVAGFAIAIVGYVLLSRLAAMGPDAPVWLAVVEMLILGLGVGFTIQTFIIAVQNAVDRHHVGVATSTITLFRSLGATFGVTLLGTVLNRILQDEMTSRVDPSWLQRFLADPRTGGKIGNVPQVLLSEEAVNGISAAPGGAEAIEGIKLSYAAGMETVFLVGAGIALVAVLVTLFLKSLPMKSAEEYHGQGGTPPVAEM